MSVITYYSNEKGLRTHRRSGRCQEARTFIEVTSEYSTTNLSKTAIAIMALVREEDKEEMNECRRKRSSAQHRYVMIRKRDLRLHEKVARITEI